MKIDLARSLERNKKIKLRRVRRLTLEKCTTEALFSILMLRNLLRGSENSPLERERSRRS